MARLPATRIGGGSSARDAAVDPNVRTPRFAPAEALATVTGALADRARDDEFAKDNVRAVQIRGQRKRRALEEISRLNPLEAGYVERARETLTSINTDLTADTGITSREVSENLELSLATSLENDLTLATVTRRAAIEEEALRVREELANLTLEQIRDDPDNVQEYLDEFSAEARSLNVGISPERVETLAADFGDAALSAQIEGLAISGRVEEARALLEEEGGNLSPEGVRNMGRRIREIQNTALSDAQAKVNRRIADIQIRIIDAQDGQQLAALRGEVEEMDAAGLMPGQLQSTRVSLIRSIEARQAALAKEGKKLADALRAREQGNLHKPAEVDLVYEHELEQLSAEHDGQPSADDMLQHLSGFVAETGRMPSRQRAFIENAEVANDPSQLAVAARMDKRISEVSPNAQTGAGQRVELTRALVELAGMDPQAAAQRVIEAVPDRATAEQRATRFRDEVFPDFDAARFFNREVLGRGFLERNVPFLGTDEAEVPARVAREAERTYSLFYRLMGEEEPALRAASNAMRRKYGTTKAGRGTPTATAYPPERHYLPAEMARTAERRPEVLERVIRDDVETALSQVLGLRTSQPEGGTGVVVDLGELNIPEPPPGLESVPPWALVADDQTEREVTTGGRASWELRVRDDYGNLVPLRVETPNGSIKLRLEAPTPEEVRGMPAWTEHLEKEADSVRFRQRVERNIARTGPGPTNFPADFLFGDVEPHPTENPVGPAVPEASVAEPEETVSEVSRRTQPTPDEEMPRGVRNMNPGNLERNQIVWEGMADDQSGDDRFVVFTSPKFGVRAMARVLQNYQEVHGLHTVREIVGRWAPPSENATREYVDFVADSVGVRRDQPLDLSDDQTMRALVEAIIRHENGVQPYSADVILEGIRMAR